jgi:hypothetical protein
MSGSRVGFLTKLTPTLHIEIYSACRPREQLSSGIKKSSQLLRSFEFVPRRPLRQHSGTNQLKFARASSLVLSVVNEE